MFKVGDTVECIDDSPYKGTGRPVVIKKDWVYTIKKFQGEYLFLENVIQTSQDGFNPCRFKLVKNYNKIIAQQILSGDL